MHQLVQVGVACKLRKLIGCHFMINTKGWKKGVWRQWLLSAWWAFNSWWWSSHQADSWVSVTEGDSSWQTSIMPIELLLVKLALLVRESGIAAFNWQTLKWGAYCHWVSVIWSTDIHCWRTTAGLWPTGYKANYGQSHFLNFVGASLQHPCHMQSNLAN